jgi:energy-coupling factor transporter ATP-binding protein EcfA2
MGEFNIGELDLRNPDEPEKFIDNSFEMTLSYVPKQEINIIKLNNEPVLTNGNIMLLVSHAGSGKSNICEAILAGALNEYADSFGFEVNIGDGRCLFIDTERTQNDINRGYKRIINRAKGYENLDFFEGDKMKRCTVRSYKLLDNVDEYLKHLWSHAKEGYNLIIVDVVTDFLDNINSLEESKKFVKQLEKILAIYDCAFLLTIHPNPKDSELKARGHIGTILQQKAESVFACIKADNNTRVLTTDFSQGKVRNAYDKVETAFMWDDDKKMFVGAEVTEKTKKKISKDYLEFDTIIEEIFETQKCIKGEDLAKIIANKTGNQKITIKHVEALAKERGTIYLNEFDGMYYRTIKDLYDNVPF